VKFTAILARAVALEMALTAVSCTGPQETDLQPPPDFVPPPLLPPKKAPLHSRLVFGQGFFPMEWATDGKTWHWMGAHGEIRLENDARPRTLRIVGWLPLEFLEDPPAIRIALEGHLLDTFVARDRTLRKEYSVGPDVLGSAPSARLIIETSATARAPGDTRDLGVSIEQVGWQ
jgi:hypothetical protein